MTKSQRWLRRLTLVLFIILGIFVFLTSTEPGLLVTVALVKKVLPGTLSINKVQGRLFGQLALEGFSYKTKYQTIKIAQAKATTKAYHLFLGRLTLDDVALNETYINIQSEPAVKHEPVNLSALLRLDIQKAHIKDTTIILDSLDNLPLHIKSIDLTTKRTFNTLSIEKAIVKTPHYQFESQGQIGLQAPYPVNAQLTVTGLDSIYKRFKAESRVAGSLDNIKLEGAVSSPFKTSILGHLQLFGEHAKIDLEANWKRLQWPVIGKAKYYSDKGLIRLKGPLSHYQITINTNLSGEGIPSSNLAVSGTGTRDQISLPVIKLNTLEGEISASTNYAINTKQWQLQLSAKHINPGRAWPGTHGDVNFTLSANGQQKDGIQLSTQVDLTQLSGNLRQHRLNGELHFKQNTNQFNFSNTRITIGNNSIMIKGGYDAKWQLAWDLHLPNLHDLSHKLNGALNSKGTLSGPQGKAITNAQLVARQLQYQKLSITSLTANINGDMTEHHAKVNVISDVASADLNLTGNYRGALWQGTVTKLAINDASQQLWQLKEASTIRLSSAEFKLKYLCIAAKSQQACLKNLAYQREAWSGNFAIQRLNAKNLEFLLPPSIHVNSTINLDATLESQFGKSRGVASIALSKGNVTYQINDASHDVPFKSVILKSELSEQGFYSYIDIATDDKRHIKGEFNLPDQYHFTLPGGDDRIQAHASLEVHEFSWLDVMLPSITNIRGKAKVTFNLDGTVAHPKVSGYFSLEDGYLDIPAAGLQLKSMQLTADAKGTNAIHINGQLTSGQGTLNITGSAALNELQLSTKLRVQGQNIQVMNTHEYDVEISPDLQIDIEPTEVTVKGTLFIPKAIIKPQDFSSTVELPDDLVIISDDQPLKKEPFPISTNIDISLGENVKLELLGLTGNIVGDMNIRQTLGKPPISTGQLSIKNGQYKAYGQELKIDQGTLFYTGSTLTNPGISLRASRDVTETADVSSTFPTLSNVFSDTSGNFNTGAAANRVKVGINATGTLENPRISLFSEPASLPQSEILTYLILGRSVSSIGSGDQNNTKLVLGALSALNLGGHDSQDISQQLEKGLGIDKLELTTVSTPSESGDLPLSNAAIVVGKAITPRLYVDYTFGLSETFNLIRISYKIARNWSAQLQTGNGTNSADILYTYERN